MADDPRKIDELDRGIVERLRVNGREGNRSLAGVLGVNEATIASRMRRLEAERVMRVVALTDMAGFGYDHLAFAFVRVSGRPVQEVAAELRSVPEIIFVNVVTGGCDVICGMLVRDRAQLGTVAGDAIAAVEGVRTVRTEIAVDVLRFDSEWAALNTGAELADPPGPPLPTGAVDALDLGIIRILQRGARTSNRSIAADLDVSEGTVRVRLRRLEQLHLIRIRAVSDLQAFGLGAAAVVGVHARPGHVAALGAALSALSGVAAVIHTVGRYAYVVILLAEDRPRLLELVMGGLQTLPGTAATEVFELVATLKHVYTWVRLVDPPAIPAAG